MKTVCFLANVIGTKTRLTQGQALHFLIGISEAAEHEPAGSPVDQGNKANNVPATEDGLSDPSLRSLRTDTYAPLVKMTDKNVARTTDNKDFSRQTDSRRRGLRPTRRPQRQDQPRWRDNGALKNPQSVKEYPRGHSSIWHEHPCSSIFEMGEASDRSTLC
jgi:hypothetical protein